MDSMAGGMQLSRAQVIAGPLMLRSLPLMVSGRGSSEEPQEELGQWGRICVCQCCLPMHLGILNSGAVAWMGTAQVCLPYMFYVGFFFCIVIVFSLAD